MPKHLIPILTITGSDSTSGAGIQADIRTISAMGGMAFSTITSITSQDSKGIHNIHDLPEEIVTGQLRALLRDVRPKAVKVGMIRSSNIVRAVRNEIVGCRNIVSAPGFLSSRGERLMDNDTIEEYMRSLFPVTHILILKCSEAELLFNKSINSNAEMLETAARLLDMGPQAVFLRGGHCTEGLVTGLLVIAGDTGRPRFFTSPNREGWELHGVGGTLSSAIATRLAMGEDIPVALSAAHKYIRCQVVYSVSSASHSLRQMELYNRFMEQVTAHCRESRDTAFYASQLNITPRYLAEITRYITGNSPKHLIAEYLLKEMESSLLSTDKTIQEISIEFGFPSQAALAKFFKKNRGISPSEFRSGK
ncbi:MAG: hydroxymethylpyrimidine/phosphomethylpyrimidine kinase [Bacteroidales bacterium]|nr:hydroxymethylpyrimidine/phosphomethylpyrimidine kinase [Bacteroidales bacterium]MCM1146960.1 hydroxymethylpyrimidine/phosphomethylpyrimidine kinase [Bacteroidales bacterium]MCM1205907.1 hydroxymethylpyrimidine/phosphomethylpyrimidine kinase [Bacillota bacterium]MCM1509852.1 hydroxymethylpyrimidine/phosphomethylpyrimidine kinase [Clostridium sp.]